MEGPQFTPQLLQKTFKGLPPKPLGYPAGTVVESEYTMTASDNQWQPKSCHQKSQYTKLNMACPWTSPEDVSYGGMQVEGMDSLYYRYTILYHLSWPCEVEQYSIILSTGISIRLIIIQVCLTLFIYHHRRNNYTHPLSYVLAVVLSTGLLLISSCHLYCCIQAM